MARRIKREDTVVIVSGNDRGKTGRVLQVLPEKNRIVVEGINLVKKAQRKTQENPQGGFADMEAPLHISNVLLFDPDAKQGVRVTIDRSSGKPVRKSRKSDHVFD